MVDLDLDLRARIYVKGYSLTQFADILNINLSTLTRWIKGKTKPSKEHLQMLARAFGITIEECQRMFE